jgi:hypothetical protein
MMMHDHCVAQVTQCLGVLSPVGHWYMAVARPSGAVSAFPREEDLAVFRIPHGVYVKMEQVCGRVCDATQRPGATRCALRVTDLPWEE